MSRIDIGGFVTGLLFTVVGVAFVLEAEGAWTFRLDHLRILGPAALVLVGVGVLVSALRSSRPPAG